jgi:hypothetical protein
MRHQPSLHEHALGQRNSAPSPAQQDCSRSLLAYLMFARVLSWLALLARSDSAKPAWSPPPGAAVETELTHRGRRVL